jgi:type I restriction enzyme M protein
MAMVEKVGHDQRGNTLFKRDEHGNEIWVPEVQNVLEMDKTAKGDITVKPETKMRVIDDQSVEVPTVFTKWKKQEGIAW